MKAHLMHAGRDFDPEAAPPPNEADLRRDLELDTLLGAMAAGDELLFETARVALLTSLTEPAEIRYRQAVLRDCLERPDVVRELYDIAVESMGAERKVSFGFLRGAPDTILHRSVQVLEILAGLLRRLRAVADERAAEFRSEGFGSFFAMVRTELDDAYLATVDDHLKRLRFRDGTLISARLGAGNKGVGIVLRRPNEDRRVPWLPRVTMPWDRSALTYRIPDRDEAGARALGELRGRGVNLVADALAQSTDHIVSFFTLLRSELGFYVGCLNLHERLTGKGEPVCFPEPRPAGERALDARGLYDACLSLTVDDRVVGNDVAADGKALVMVTGANQGGKSTLLRSVGVAQLMLQAGMFVPADALRAAACTGLFSHYRREEDHTMRSGKLDEELVRMSAIADRIRAGGMLLCNESFQSTNEREGSEIARQVVRALVDAGVRVVYVTHLSDLAGGFHREGREDALFLRAERERTFRLVEAEPLPTSFGEDLYERIFGAAVSRP